LPSFVKLRAPIVALALGVPTLGCMASGDDESALGGGGGFAGSTQPPNAPTSLTFDPADTLKLTPGETRELELNADPPPGVYRVRFTLLGDAENASLDRSEADTDPTGRTVVRLTAPTHATLFSLRASVGQSVSASAAVSVSASGFANLAVVPNYTGHLVPISKAARRPMGTSSGRRWALRHPI
jgi:hypothetical protein